MMIMTTIDGSDSPQYFAFQLLPDNLSNRQRDDYFQGIFVADLRSAFALITNLQKHVTELQLHGQGQHDRLSITFDAVDNPADAEPGSRSANLVVHACCGCS